MKVPYKTKSGLQIGVYYQPQQKCEMSYDMERLQKALLYQGPQRLRTFSIIILLMMLIGVITVWASL